MKQITDKRVAEVYTSLQRHFDNGSYDITKYGYHPIRISLSTYVKKYPVKYCQFLADKVRTEKVLFEVCVPSFVQRDWYLVDFVDDYSNREQERFKWLTRIQFVQSTFKDSCYDIKNAGVEFDASFSEYLLDLYMTNKLELEVFCVFIKLLNMQFKDNFIWELSSIGDKIQAYQKIAVMSPQKIKIYKNIFREVFS